MCDPVITGASSGSVPGRVREHVADLVDLDHQAEVVHPRHDEIAAGPIIVGQSEPGTAALASGTYDLADRAQLVNSGGGADRHRHAEPSPPTLASDPVGGGVPTTEFTSM